MAYTLTWIFPCFFDIKVDKDDYLHVNARQSGGLLLREERATRDKPFLATLKARRLLTDTSKQVDDKVMFSNVSGRPEKTNAKLMFQRQYHLVIDVSSSGDLLGYLPGDALGVLPENDPKEVDRLVPPFN